MWHPYLTEHYGDLASVVGLILTIVGFVATIWNVRKAKQTAEEARQAAREALSKIGSQILAIEIGTSLELVIQADAACHKKDGRSDLARSRTSAPRLFRDNRRLGAKRSKLRSRRAFRSDLSDLEMDIRG